MMQEVCRTGLPYGGLMSVNEAKTSDRENDVLLIAICMAMGVGVGVAFGSALTILGASLALAIGGGAAVGAGLGAAVGGVVCTTRARRRSETAEQS